MQPEAPNGGTNGYKQFTRQGIPGKGSHSPDVSQMRGGPDGHPGWAKERQLIARSGKFVPYLCLFVEKIRNMTCTVPTLQGIILS